jgi:predicted phosphodiesterase
MKICAISDTHNQHSELKIPECDILIHAGDFTNNGTFN